MLCQPSIKFRQIRSALLNMTAEIRKTFSTSPSKTKQAQIFPSTTEPKHLSITKIFEPFVLLLRIGGICPVEIKKNYNAGSHWCNPVISYHLLSSPSFSIFMILLLLINLGLWNVPTIIVYLFLGDDKENVFKRYLINTEKHYNHNFTI